MDLESALGGKRFIVGVWEEEQREAASREPSWIQVGRRQIHSRDPQGRVDTDEGGECAEDWMGFCGGDPRDETV